MSKDPAVLFYTSDFLTGTMLMSFEQKGKYITLLCLQHQKGILSEKDMFNICISYDKDVFDKFVKTDLGYYNERMKSEFEKRSKFSKSRSDNRLNGIEKKKLIELNKTSYDNHMENENENEDLDIPNYIKDASKNLSELLSIEKCLLKVLTEQKYIELILMNNKIDIGKCKTYLSDFNNYLIRTGEESKMINDYKKHFSNWLPIYLSKQKENPIKKPNAKFIEKYGKKD